MKRFSHLIIPYFSIRFNLYTNLAQLFIMNHMFEFIFKNPSNVYPFSKPVFSINFRYIINRDRCLSRTILERYNYCFRYDNMGILRGDFSVEKAVDHYTLFCGLFKFKKSFYDIFIRVAEEYKYISQEYICVKKSQLKDLKKVIIKKKLKNKNIYSHSIWRQSCL